ncbi:unnamed protein product [Adineta ricciae]|uniref:Uncharacterized protein n=1 Tax=Adineta ricciae TaxID=249248 RepID=A0A814USW9_ADIRI|nr:unnamed protein product [Adineta ricciae]
MMILFRVFVYILLINYLSSIQIEQTLTRFKVRENSPNDTVVGVIPTYFCTDRIILLDNANGRFRINANGEILVSKFILLN